jgi:hypothetical protein
MKNLLPGILSYQWVPRKPVTAKISEISAKKKTCAKLVIMSQLIWSCFASSRLA